MWIAYASAAAICFGLRGILYQWTSQKPLDRSLMLFGVYLFGTIVSLTATSITGQPWTEGALMGLVMGLFSYISNASMYKGFAVGKTSLVAIITALPAVVVIVGAYVLWQEKLNFGQIIAFVVILGGIVMIRYSNELSFSNLNGVQWAIIAMLGFAVTDLSSKQATIWNGFTFPTLTLMYGTGTAMFFSTWLRSVLKARPAKALSVAGRSFQLAAAEAAVSKLAGTDDEEKTAVLPAVEDDLWPYGKTVVWGMVVGITNISGMVLLMPAFKYGVTGLVSAISAMSVVLILLYARLILRDPFSRMETAGALLTLAGIVVLRLLG
ncbi:EamA family transporter [Paenibacillus sp. MBLB4367]|uniref:EamA family transporter n=1 Tax=Paenibacillus sp. MBLB4367 TaxID=3384767 RepID=UPI00390804EA